jgi:hypothetical protein
MTVGTAPKGFPGIDGCLAGRLIETVTDLEPTQSLGEISPLGDGKIEGSVNQSYKGFFWEKVDKLAIFRGKENSIRQI